MDCDVVFVDDIKNLFDQADDQYAVMVVKHDYAPKEGLKMDGCKQLPYPRKNWSSMILWNCGHPSNQQLTLEVVNAQTGQFLHRFQWLDDAEIGSLSPEWNWLAIEYPENRNAKLIHYTLGTPCFKDYRDTEMSEIWHETQKRVVDGFDK